MISFPRDLPAGIGFEPARFRLSESIQATASEGGALAHAETATPVWGIRFTSEPLDEGQVQEIEAWRETLRGGINRVLVTQNVTCRPKAHDAVANAAPAQTAGTVDSVSGASVTISGVSASLHLQAGDLVGFVLVSGGSTYRALARVAEESPAGTTTRAIAFTRAPRAYACAAGAAAVFENPKLAMTTPSGAASFALADGAFPTLSFDLVEVMA